MFSGVLAAGLLGSLIGSFLNVVIYRMPLRLSIVSPPSACPGCGARIRGYDNVPVFSWLVLRGRCRDCRAAISARYPLVELGTAVFFGVVGWWVLTGGVSTGSTQATGSTSGGVSTGSTSGTSGVGEVVATGLVLVAFLYLAAISVALTLIDLDTHTLPNRIVLPAYLVGGALLLAAAILTGDYGRLVSAGIGLAALWLAYLLMAFAYPGGMGLGDVKLAGVLGLYLGWLGWGPLAVGAFGAFILGGLFGLALLITRRASRTSGIPFGPWMLAGAWTGVFGGAAIAGGYLSIFGLA